MPIILGSYNWYRREFLWPILRYCPRIYVEQEKTFKIAGTGHVSKEAFHM
jgi:hypothetical protein